jgi:hypothetical protein
VQNRRAMQPPRFIPQIISSRNYRGTSKPLPQTAAQHTSSHLIRNQISATFSQLRETKNRAHE